VGKQAFLALPDLNNSDKREYELTKELTSFFPGIKIRGFYTPALIIIMEMKDSILKKMCVPISGLFLGHI